MKKLTQIAGACAATAMLAAATPAFAQSPATGSNAQGETRGQNMMETRQDNNRDWGWIGLLGLIGLAGLKGRDRHHDDNARRNTNVPGRA